VHHTSAVLRSPMRTSASYVLYPPLDSVDIQQCTSVVYTSVPTTATAATVLCYVYIHPPTHTVCIIISHYKLIDTVNCRSHLSLSSCGHLSFRNVPR